MKAMSTDLLEYLPQGEGQTLLDDLLGEQQLLTPVARFSLKHDLGNLPAQAKYYRDLIPFSLPAAGQQYAFAVDLDACTGCKACVTACHSMNGLDEEETWPNRFSRRSRRRVTIALIRRVSHGYRCRRDAN
jgi:NAD-dependent dihydropyrimidine dehydrogenase PreA subunit